MIFDIKEVLIGTEGGVDLVVMMGAMVTTAMDGEVIQEKDVEEIEMKTSLKELCQRDKRRNRMTS